MSLSLSLMNPRNNKKYDVFLSFRGEDTRNNFTSHLYEALSQKSIETFIDDQLIRGDEISHSLLDTIEASTISIIIFSERYASSGWCLDELLKILECKHDYGRIVIPVFYRVDPSHVRWQTGTFGDFFSKLEGRFPEKMHRWRNALTKAANLSGFDSHVIRPECKLIEEIANEVLERLDYTFQSENKDLVGVECPIEEIESLLCTRSAGVCKLGIWGIGGIGKTTIAGAVFNRISRHFEGSYFAHNVRDAEETGRIEDLRKELLSNLLNDRNVRNVESQLKRLARKKVLIVFDDVDHPRQIELLIGRLDVLASESRVIITTRDKQVLKNCWVDQIYLMKELAHADAHKLFCQCAFGFGVDHPDASYTELTQKAIEYAQGVPLALKVLGRYLCGRSKEEWESAIRKLKIIPHMEIQEVLKISYDSLDDSQKNVFLDIACFLEGEHRDEVISFFDASGFQAKIELSVLKGKSLITVDLFGQIRMHDLLRDMGREIIRKESIHHPGKRSRLWHHKDIYEVLKKNMGTEAIKGISLDMRKVNSEIQINPYTFSKMTELRFLKFYGYENKCMVSYLEGVPFTEVRYFQWHQCPLKTLNIHAENLVSLKMPGSRVKQLWDDVQNLLNLKNIDLSYSESLTKLPDLSLARNLEILDLGGCSSLTETHSSIQYLDKLEVLDLRRCESLRSLPASIHSKYLKELDFWGCSKLKNFPEISSSHIRLLFLIQVGIKELPSSIDCLSKLKTLAIHNCTRLENISSSIFKLKSLESIEIYGCSNLKRFLEVPCCNTDGSNAIERQASFKLRLENCSSLESLSCSLCMFKSLTSLEIVYCPKLERLPDELGNLEALVELRVEGAAIREIPESLGQLALLYKLELKKCSSFESLPSSLCMSTSLKSLEIIDCKNFKRFPDELGNLEYLKVLTVKETAIREVPESLGQLSSLEYLELSNNNLERILECLDRLSSLKRLQLYENNLARIPEYLRSFPTSIPSKLTSFNLFVDLRNCLKLDWNELSEIVKDGWMKQSFHGERRIKKSMYFPGNEIPKWFRHQSMGSIITLKTLPPPQPAGYDKLIGFAFCAVVAFPVPKCFRHQSVEDDQEGNLYDVYCDWKFKSKGYLSSWFLGRISHVQSDHVLLGSNLFGMENFCPSYDEFFFRIQPSFDPCLACCEVKKCGIHFVYAQDSAEPHPKRLKYF